MSAQNGHDPQPIPLADLMEPMLESARKERGELQSQARALREKASRAEDAAKGRRQDLAWLDNLIKSLPEDNKRLPEYQKIRESQSGMSERLEGQAREARAEAVGMDERLMAIDGEIQMLEKVQTPAKQQAQLPHAKA